MTQLQGWPQLACAAAFGVLAAFGQAPYDLPLLLLLGFVGAIAVFRSAESPYRAAVLGWAFGLGYFAHTLQWIVSPFFVDAARHGWMAPFAVAFMAAGLALFWGLAFWLARRLGQDRNWPLILCLPAAELMRAYVFTGFPWGMPAQAMVNSFAGQGLSLFGPYALNLIIIAAAFCLSRIYRHPLLLATQVITCVLSISAILVPPLAPNVKVTPHVIRMVQPNVPQRDKWDPEQIPIFFDRHLALTATAPEDIGKLPDLVLWSETAIPWRLEYAGTALHEIAVASGGTPVALGLQRAQNGDYFNSLAVLDEAGEPEQLYDKHHLVPFGEYVPLAKLLNRLGIFGLAQQVPSGYGRGPGAKLLDFGPLGRALPLICYEAVFPHHVNATPERPDFLLQITNDAWFGKGAGPHQHLAQARMRAIEQGLPLARSANTGISAMIDPYGRVTKSLPLNSAGIVDAVLPAPLPPTWYSRTGDLPLSLLLAICIAALVLTGIRRGNLFED